jgi:pimeloyl-ACP methyl ester carboxylesterase
MRDAAKGALIRAAASTQRLARCHSVMQFNQLLFKCRIKQFARAVLRVLVIAGFLSVSIGILHAQSPPPAPGQLIDIGGRRLHVNCTGVGTPIVVVENGSGAFSVDWALVQPVVSKFTRICTYDRAGYAWSDPGPLRDFPDQNIGDLQLLLRVANVRPPYVLVGQSIGGILVRDYQRRFPQQVAGMILVDPTHDEGLAYFIDGKPKAISLVTREELDKFMRDLLANPPAPPPTPIRIRDPFNRLPPELQPVRLWAETRYFADRNVNRTPFLGEAQRQEFIALRAQRLAQAHPLGRLPLIVLTNGVNKQKAELAALSETGKLVVAEKSCHEIQLCSPELVVRAIRDVVIRVRQKQPSGRRP